jgi:hypothetical protein
MFRMTGAMSVRLIGAALAFLLVAIGFAPSARAQTSTNGLIMLIEFERIEGIRHWEHELGERGLSALIQVQSNILNEYRDDFARLAARGYTVAGNDAEKPFWDMPYDEQLRRMREAKQAVERITHKPMRVFGSRYFAYDENTLRVADALDIDYVLGRGTAGALATVYAPREYKAKSSRSPTFPSQRWAPVRSAIIACGRAARPATSSARWSTRCSPAGTAI